MDTSSNLVDRLKTVRHFKDLSQTDLESIVASGNLRRFVTGQTIFGEGEPCAGMFVLIRGMVHLCKFGPQGQINIISVVKPVIMFNEVAVLDGGPNPVTAIAAEDCLLWQVGYQAFQELLKKVPQVGLGLLQVLARRNRELITHYEDLSFRTVVGRTAKLLLELSDGGNHPIDRHSCSIEQMAARIATVPEAISRSLNTIKRQGLIKVSRNEIAVVSIEKLSHLANIVTNMGKD